MRKSSNDGRKICLSLSTPMRAGPLSSSVVCFSLCFSLRFAIFFWVYYFSPFVAVTNVRRCRRRESLSIRRNFRGRFLFLSIRRHRRKLLRGLLFARGS